MEFMTPIDLKQLPSPISYADKILLVGSCFTEHIGNSLKELKFDVMQNPNGILFDPASVCASLISYIENVPLTAKDFFELNEVWNSWAHHSRYSHISLDEAVHQANESRQRAHDFLKQADWIIVTLGSSFSYRLRQDQVSEPVYTGDSSGLLPVANCHRAPATWFTKHLMEIGETITLLDTCYYRLRIFNPKIKILFTVSPVRHLRDGVVENNRSKARLIEAVHHMTGKFDHLFYFPAYELVIDILRDYRFYDTDFAHPNYAATGFVLEKFSESCIDPGSQKIMSEVRKLMIARKHRALQPATNAHRQFLLAHHEKAKELQAKFPFLDLAEEISYFKDAANEIG
ncbi:MAG: GSCFA domain-containing protein [Chitinophagaceae bacterium]|nr:MAG: GSCFA domain-containing protein [Chitinophagaceae bacterium]